MIISNYKVYAYFHSHCPECNSKNNTRTLAGVNYSSDSGIKDINKVVCENCKWIGIVDDLLPKDKDHGPLKAGHVCKHGIRCPHACTWCEDYIYGLITEKFPLL